MGFSVYKTASQHAGLFLIRPFYLTGGSMTLETLVYNTDFQRAYRRGKALVHPQLVLYVRKNNHGKTRVGFTCSKKVGNAVKRNRARRVMKQGLSMAVPEGIGSYDLVLVARAKTPFLKSHQLAQTLGALLKKEKLA